MKGIILAGGSGTRLYPTTLAVNKHLLPVYDKPMIYYPLTTLMQANIRDILLISTPEDLLRYRALLGDGTALGIHLSYSIQASPLGIAQALLIGEAFIEDQPCSLILGDNIFIKEGLSPLLAKAEYNAVHGISTLFISPVDAPSDFGIVQLNPNGSICSIEEKPVIPKSNLAVTGLYFYDRSACELAKKVKKSQRNELEITDLNNLYLAGGKLDCISLDCPYSWMDAGTPDCLLRASSTIHALQARSGHLIGSPEETAYRSGWISRKQLLERIALCSGSLYARYLEKL